MEQGHYYCYACRREVPPEDVNGDWEHTICGCVVNWSEDEIDILEEGYLDGYFNKANSKRETSMIDGNDNEGYRLYCDNCGDDCDEYFDTFYDAVEYKTDRNNGWASVKGKDGDWYEFCPACNRPDIIAKIRGVEYDEPSKFSGKDAARLASMGNTKFEGF